MNYRHLFSAFLALGILLTACDKQTEEPALFSGDIYVLNNGNWGDNNSNIAVYNLQNKELAADAFFNANDIALGDLGQDIIVYGKDIYIAVYGSKCIFVTDKSLKIKKMLEIATEDGTRLSPRTFCQDNDRVYVTMYEGFVAEINPGDGYSVRITQVGNNPEGIAYAGGKLYVANSGGMNYPNYDNTVSVVDASSFKEISRITVNLNPCCVAANSDGTLVFVSSLGDYAMTPGMLQAISTSTGEVTDLGYENIAGFSMGTDDRLYVLTAGYDENWNQLPGTVYVQDARTTSTTGVKFVTDGTSLDNAYSVSATSDGYVYIGISDYVNNGDIKVFDSNGRLYDSFDTSGLNPLKVAR
ncbi:MAG: YncE family protein [Candidatus Cryptobacteroides sp.]